MVDRQAILIVEDEDALREELLELVTTLGYGCYAAASGQEALAIQAGGKIGTLLCDLHLDGESGFELIRQVRGATAPPGTDIKIIAMTGHTDLIDNARQELSRFADAILLKPIHVRTLRDLLAAPGASLSHVGHSI